MSPDLSDRRALLSRRMNRRKPWTWSDSGWLAAIVLYSFGSLLAILHLTPPYDGGTVFAAAVCSIVMGLFGVAARLGGGFVVTRRAP